MYQNKIIEHKNVQVLYAINDIDTALTFHTIAGAPIERSTMKHVAQTVAGVQVIYILQKKKILSLSFYNRLNPSHCLLNFCEKQNFCFSFPTTSLTLSLFFSTKTEMANCPTRSLCL